MIICYMGIRERTHQKIKDHHSQDILELDRRCESCQSMTPL